MHSQCGACSEPAVAALQSGRSRDTACRDRFSAADGAGDPYYGGGRDMSMDKAGICHGQGSRPARRQSAVCEVRAGGRGGRELRDPARGKPVARLMPIEPGKRILTPEQQAARQRALERMRGGLDIRCCAIRPSRSDAAATESRGSPPRRDGCSGRAGSPIHDICSGRLGRQRPPATWRELLQRLEARLVGHLLAAGDPIAQVHVGQPEPARALHVP
jgi:hypothetical protein